MKGKVWKRTMQILGFFIICGMALFSHKANQSHSMPNQSTLKDNLLGKCSPKPNCVSTSHNTDEEHYIAPFEIGSFNINDADNFFKACKVIEKNQFYRYYTCETNLFKFVDDVEIYFYDGKLQLRSASRVGHSDLGANRERLELFRLYLKK